MAEPLSTHTDPPKRTGLLSLANAGLSRSDPRLCPRVMVDVALLHGQNLSNSHVNTAKVVYSYLRSRSPTVAEGNKYLRASDSRKCKAKGEGKELESVAGPEGDPRPEDKQSTYGSDAPEMVDPREGSRQPAEDIFDTDGCDFQKEVDILHEFISGRRR